MAHPPVTVTIITLNEEEHIQKAIKSVAWAQEIIVVDSGSTDQTIELARNLGAQVIHNPWPGYGQQKNFAQSLATHSWVLNIDADEEVSPELRDEILNAISEVQSGKLRAEGFFFPRKTFYLGRWIQHGGWYPNLLVRLAHKNFARWTEPSVHEELQVKGNLVGLRSPLHHYAFASIHDQILTNLKFSQLGSQDLEKNGQRPGVGRLILKPIGKFFETYFLKRGFLDGLPGFIISINAAHSMFLKYAFLNEARIKNENSNRR